MISREPLGTGGPDDCDRLQPAAEVVAVWQEGDPVNCTPAGKKPLRVLVADGNQDAADSLSMLVEGWGHEVRRAHDGATALEMACDYRPDVLLLEMALPKLDGCYLAQQLRRQPRFKDTLLVAITGYSDPEHRRLGEEAGFDHYFAKPVEPSTLESLLLLEQDRLAESLWELASKADSGPSAL